jgi:hypothetical protein
MRAPCPLLGVLELPPGAAKLCLCDEMRGHVFREHMLRHCTHAWLGLLEGILLRPAGQVCSRTSAYASAVGCTLKGACSSDVGVHVLCLTQSTLVRALASRTVRRMLAPGP